MKPAKHFLTFALSALTTFAATAKAESTAPRPKQYVVISFDGSRSVQMWKETRELAKELNSGLTVFMSGVHFIPETLLKKYYDPPGAKYGPGTSAIKKILDSQKETIPERIEQIEEALDSGVEVGSHAVGHFDAGHGPSGLNWSTNDWISEITQFQNIVLNIFAINSLHEKFPNEAMVWKQRVGQSLRGFRAPLLETNGTLAPALVKMGYAYDGSEVYPMERGLWPFKKKEGIWEIPMAQIPIAGTARHQVAMDYNFFVFDSHAKNDLANSKFYEKRFYQSLMNYFRHNYYGNRAPVHAGAHFDDWNGRAYFTAFFRFARTVCRQPEVECVTGSEMVAKLKEMGPAQIAAYQRGEFEKLPKPAGLKSVETLDIKIGWTPARGNLQLASLGTDSNRADVRYEVFVDRQKVSSDLNGFALPAQTGVHEVSVQVLRGQREIFSSTRRLEIQGASLHNLELRDREDRFQKGDLPGAHGLPDRSESEPIQWQPLDLT